MTKQNEFDVWKVEIRALTEIVGDLPTNIRNSVSAVIQDIEQEIQQHRTENLSDF